MIQKIKSRASFMVSQIDRAGQIRLAFALSFFHTMGCMSNTVYSRYWKLLEDTSTLFGDEFDELQLELDELSALRDDDLPNLPDGNHGEKKDD